MVVMVGILYHMSELSTLQEATAKLIESEELIKLGGGERGIERQHRHGRLTARERIELLADKGTTQFECGLLIAHNMYEEFGGAPSAGFAITAQGLPDVLYLNQVLTIVGGLLIIAS